MGDLRPECFADGSLAALCNHCCNLLNCRYLSARRCVRILLPGSPRLGPRPQPLPGSVSAPQRPRTWAEAAGETRAERAGGDPAPSWGPGSGEQPGADAKGAGANPAAPVPTPHPLPPISGGDFCPHPAGLLCRMPQIQPVSRRLVVWGPRRGPVRRHRNSL